MLLWAVTSSRPIQLKDKCFEEILYVPKHLKQPWTSEHGFRIILVFTANDIPKD